MERTGPPNVMIRSFKREAIGFFGVCRKDSDVRGRNGFGLARSSSAEDVAKMFLL